MSTIKFNGNTDLGRIRSNNEDAYVAQKIWDEDHLLLVVIDGVGGQEGGEIAAGIARDEIVKYLKDYPNGERLTLLKQAVNEANNIIFYERSNQPEYANMSCVLTACLVEISKMTANMVHVGDTRLYTFSENQLIKISHDHSIIGYREEIGDLTEEEAMKHPQRNIIGRDVGSEFHKIDDEDFMEATSFSFMPGNMLLLCSDGLSDLLNRSEIREILQHKVSVEDKITSLINEANRKGGKDNITVVLADYKKEKTEEFPGMKSPEPEPADTGHRGSEVPANDIQKVRKQTDNNKRNTINLNHSPKNRNFLTPVFCLLCFVAGALLGWFAYEYLSNTETDQLASPDLQIESTHPPVHIDIDSFNDKDIVMQDTTIYRVLDGEQTELNDLKVYRLENESDSISVIFLLNKNSNPEFILKEIVYSKGEMERE